MKTGKKFICAYVSSILLRYFVDIENNILRYL